MMKPRQYNTTIDITLNEYRKSHVSAMPEATVTGEGLTIQYPSISQTTIAQGRDFYIIGQITKLLPDNSSMNVNVRERVTGNIVRNVHAQVKNNEKGMYVDYPNISITGDKEAFRKSCMPDLVYDGTDLNSFANSCIKAYFTDNVFTCLIYGGTPVEDVSPYDENGIKMDVLPFGDYVIEVTIGPYSVSMDIRIDDIANKILARFHPMNHRQNVIDEAEKMGYTMFLDPFPGYWDTQMFNPEWGVNYIADNPRRWKQNDALEYKGGRIQTYIYDTKASSTSFSVELGYMQYNGVVENPERIAVHYYDSGDPVTPDGKTKGKFTEFHNPKGTNWGPMRFTRVDIMTDMAHSNIEEEYSPTKIRSIACDLEHIPLKNPDDDQVTWIRIMGVLRPLQSGNVIYNKDSSTYTYTNGVRGVQYILEDDKHATYRFDAEDNYGINLTRCFKDGSTETSILEFAHIIPLLSTTIRGTEKLYLKYRVVTDSDKYLPDTGGYIHIATFEVL